MSVNIDIIDGADLAETTAGFTATRIAIVTGVGDQGTKALATALLFPSIPSIGSRHPLFNVIPILCTGKTVKAVSPANSDIIHVTLLYGNFSEVADGGGIILPVVGDAPELEIGSTLQTVTTDTDAFGNQIFVEYITVDEDFDDKTVSRPGTVQIQVPLTTLSFTRREAVNPLAKSRRFVGALNSVALFGGNDPPRSWLCTRITGRTPDGGRTFMVNYGFQRADNTPDVDGFRTDTWDALVSYIDPETGEIPIDAKINGPRKGKRLVQVYPNLQDFRQLLLGL